MAFIYKLEHQDGTHADAPVSQLAGNIMERRRVYDCRHTFATCCPTRRTISAVCSTPTTAFTD